mgnify:FL=1
MAAERRVVIRSDRDIVVARQEGRALAERLGFTGTDLVAIATAISEIARNIIQYAGEGEVVLSEVRKEGRSGILIVARDQGPGIANLELAMQDGYSTSGGLGLGLSGARRLVDEFEIVSELGKGTTVTMRKWLQAPA